MLRKIILGIVAFVFISTGVQAGVGILEASKQAGFEISCPEGAANCSESKTEAKDYSTVGTQNFVLRLLGGILNFAAIIAVLMLVVVGVRLVIAMGNQEGLQAAKKQLLWTFGGLAVIILSLLIVKNITEKIYEAAQDCLSIEESGIYGDKTEQAKGETPKVAESWSQGNWELDGKTFDENIFGFQKEFNLLKCVDGERQDSEKQKQEQEQDSEKQKEDCEPVPAKILTAPASCFTGNIKTVQNLVDSEECKDTKKLITPVCAGIKISDESCSVKAVQEKLGATPDGTGRAPDNYYYETISDSKTPISDPKKMLPTDCSKADGLYGLCTQKAINNYFSEHVCK